MFRESGDHVKATKGRVSSKEWIIGLSFVHSQEQAEGIPFLYCLWDVGVDRMAFCGESNRQGPALARNKPASHSCQSQNSDCVQENLGMTAFLVNTLLFAVRLQASQKPHILVLVPYKVHLRSSKTSTLNRNTWGPVTIQVIVVAGLSWARSLSSFSALALLCGPDVWCNVRSSTTSLALTRSQGHDIKNIPKDYQVSGGPRSFSHKH